jgi:hypothetical protein
MTVHECLLHEGWTTFHVEVIGLAREVSADWVLPSALYRLCSLFSTNDLLDSFLEPDGALSLPDLHLCLKAYTKLQTI